jgi:hypothetical protein
MQVLFAINTRLWTRTETDLLGDTNDGGLLLLLAILDSTVLLINVFLLHVLLAAAEISTGAGKSFVTGEPPWEGIVLIRVWHWLRSNCNFPSPILIKRDLLIVDLRAAKDFQHIGVDEEVFWWSEQ